MNKFTNLLSYLSLRTKMLTVFVFVSALLFTWQTQAQVSYTANFDTSANSWTGGLQSTTSPCTVGSYRANAYASAPEKIMVSPLLGTSNAGEVTFSFDYKIYNFTGGAATPNTFGTAYIEHSTTATGPWTTAGTIGVEHVASTDCVQKQVTFTAAPGNLYARIRVVWAVGDYYFAIDNVAVSQGAAPACVPPTGAATTDLTAAGATANWTASTSNPSNGYEYEVRTSGAGGSGATGLVAFGDAATTSVGISGLNPITTYYVYVRSDCGTEFSAWNLVSSFKTLCAPVSSYTQAFEGLATGSTAPMPDCWNKIATGSVYNTTGSVAPASPGNHLYMYTSTTTTALASLPEFSNAGAGTHRLKFRARGTVANLVLSIGYMTNNTDAATYTELTTITPAITYGNDYYTVTPGTTPGAATYLAFKKMATLAGGVYIDDISWEPIPTCLEPTAVAVSGVTATGANVAWTSAGSNFDIKYGAPGFNVATEGTLVENIANPYALSGLTPNTNYAVYVRQNCGAGGVSLWTGPINFKTECLAGTEFSENFDSYTLTGSANPLPDCWSRAGTTGSSYIITGGGAPMSGANRLYLYASGTTPTVAYATMPLISNLGANTHRLKFKAYATVASKTIDVGYLTTPGDVSTFQLIQTVNLPSTALANTQEFFIVPGTLATTTGNLCFKLAPTTLTTTVYIDDVVWEMQPPCNQPTTLTATSITSTTATLSWTGDGTVYDIEIGELGFTPTGTPTFDDQTNNFEMESLTGNTSYSYYVRQDCGVNGTSIWVGPFTFKTLCDGVTTFSQNFDTAATGTTAPMPDCWFRAGNGSAYVTTGSVAPMTPSNRLYLFSSATAAPPTKGYVIMPLVTNANAQTHRLKFKAYSTTAAGKVLNVGYVTSPTDMNTYVNIADFSMPGTAAAAAQEFVLIPGSTLPAEAYLVFKNDQATATAAIYIDDVIWEALPACPEPNALTASLITNNSATLSWGGLGTVFDIEWGLNGFVQGAGTMVDNVSNNYLLTGLLAQSTYQYYVRQECTSEQSIWVGPFTFTTQCDPATEYTMNFDSSPTGSAVAMPTCWGRLGSGSAYVTTGSVAPATPANRLYLYASSTAATVAYAVMPTISNGSAGTHRLRFKAYATAINNTLSVGYVTDVNNAATYTEIGLVSLTTTTAATIKEYTVQPGMLPANAVALAFKTNPASGATTTVYIDDVAWEVLPACAEPSTPFATAITTTGATLGWMSSGTAFDVEYGAYGFTQGSGTMLTGITNNYALSGLNPGTQYQFYVRNNCGTENSPWVGPITFATQCTIVTEYSMNFEGYATGSTVSMPLCWDRTGTTGSSYITTGAVAPMSPANRLYLYASSTTPSVAYAVMPQISNAGAGTHRLRFKAHTTVAGNQLSVGYVTNPTDMSTFTLLQNVTINPTTVATSELYEVLPGTAPGTAQYLVFKNAPATSTATFYIDDVSWEAIPTCEAPLSVSGSPLSYTTATLSWTASVSNPANGYEYYVSTTNTAPNATTIPSGAVATGLTTTLSALNPQTIYYAWVRAVCGAADKSPWSPMAQFKTDYCSPAPTSVDGSGITNVTLGTINNTTAAETGNYGNYSTMIADVEQGATVPVNITFTTATYYYGAKIWVDWNNDLQFDDVTERVFYVDQSSGSATSPWIMNANFMVPAAQAVGNYRLRIGALDVPGTDGASITPCYASSYGTYEDYTINVVVPNPCQAPTALVASDVMATTATVSWTASTTATNGYEYYVSTSSTAPTAGTTPTGMTTNMTVNLTALASQTTHYVWVRSNCGSSSYSPWSSSVMFTTLCEPIATLPWTEGFETAVLPNMVNCWKKENGDWVTTNNANSTYDANARTGAQFLREAYSATNEYVWTPGFQLTAGTSYDFSFWWAGDTYAGWDATVYTNTAQTSAGAAVLGAPFVAAGTTTSTTYAQVTNSFVPTTSGIYYFAIKVNCTSAPWYLSFDDFEVKLTPIPAPANNDCSSATVLTPGGVFADSPATGTNVGATASTDAAPTCGSYNGGDVWYSVVVPTAGNLTIETNTDGIGLTNTDLAVYSGTCGALTQIACDDNSSDDGEHAKVALTGLTAGSTLYVRVWENGGDATGTFKVSAYDVSLGTNNFDVSNFKAYPNPVSDVLNLTYTYEISEVKVFNMLGQEVLVAKPNTMTAQIGMNQLNAGTYLVEVTANGATKTMKVVKK